MWESTVVILEGRSPNSSKTSFEFCFLNSESPVFERSPASSVSLVENQNGHKNILLSFHLRGADVAPSPKKKKRSSDCPAGEADSRSADKCTFDLV